MAKLVKTLRFSATRNMVLAKDQPPELATMPCHVTATMLARAPVTMSILGKFEIVCSSLEAYLKSQLHGRTFDQARLPHGCDAASLATYLAQHVIPAFLAQSKLRLESVKVMFGVVEEAEAGPRKKAVLRRAWDDAPAVADFDSQALGLGDEPSIGTQHQPAAASP